MNIPSTPRFGAALLSRDILGRLAVQVSSIYDGAPGDITWRDAQYQVHKVDHSPDLAQVEAEMTQCKGQNPAPGLAAEWIATIKKAVEYALVKTTLPMPLEHQVDYLVNLRCKDTQNEHKKLEDGVHIITIAHNPPDYDEKVQAFNLLSDARRQQNEPTAV